MKYLFILFLFGCGVSAQKIDKDVEFEELIEVGIGNYFQYL